MDERRFGAPVLRWISGVSRRALLRGWAGGALAGLTNQATAAGCLQEGEDCRRGRQCCSGLCKRRRCRRAPDQGICTIRKNTCRDGNGTLCGMSGPAGCFCHVTTRGTSFCGAGLACRAGGACTRDSDCDAVFGPGSACVRGCCGDTGGGGCVARCPNPT